MFLEGDVEELVAIGGGGRWPVAQKLWEFSSSPRLDLEGRSGYMDNKIGCVRPRFLKILPMVCGR